MDSLKSYQLAYYTKNEQKINRRGFERLDLMLLAIEAIDINAHHVIISAIEALGFKKQFPNLVEVWKFRCKNPLRKTPEKSTPTNETTQALIVLLSFLSEYFYPRIRQLLSSKEPSSDNKQRWNQFESRLNDLISERMNPGRAAIKRYLNSYDSDFYRDIIISLALCSGSGGVNRLRASLLDLNK